MSILSVAQRTDLIQTHLSELMSLQEVWATLVRAASPASGESAWVAAPVTKARPTLADGSERLQEEGWDLSASHFLCTPSPP